MFAQNQYVGTQIERVINTDVYDYSCTNFINGGYECVAVRADLFDITSSGILPDSCENGSGSDTGFQAVTVVLDEPILGPYSPEDFGLSFDPAAWHEWVASFSIFNAHLASPLSDQDGSCRTAQIQSAFGRPVKASGKHNAREASTRLSPERAVNRARFIALGDFNTDPKEDDEPGKALRSVIAPYNFDFTYTNEDLWCTNGYPNIYEGQFISNPITPTFLVPLRQDALDHVISSFAMGTCSPTSAGNIYQFDHQSTICTVWGLNRAAVRTKFTFTGPNGAELHRLGPIFMGRSGISGLGQYHEHLQDKEEGVLFIPDGTYSTATVFSRNGTRYLYTDSPRFIRPMAAGEVQQWHDRLDYINVSFNSYGYCDPVW
jgi:hypothetical protein